MVVHERSRFNGGGKYLFATGSYLSAHKQPLASSRHYVTHGLNSLPTNANQQRIPLRTDLCDRAHEPSMALNLDTSRNSRRSLSVRTLLLVASIAAIGPLRTVTVFDCLVPLSSAITFKVRAFSLFGGDLQTTRAIPPLLQSSYSMQTWIFDLLLLADPTLLAAHQVLCPLRPATHWDDRHT